MKFISLILSFLLTFYTGFLQNEKSIQNFFDNNFSTYCFIGRAYANTVRKLENKYEKLPEEAVYRKKIVADDTDDNFVTNPEKTINTQTWISNELVFESKKEYKNPFDEVNVDLILVGNGVKYIIPGFWDGDYIWKIRFVCPYEGEWLYKTVCNDTENTELNGRTGKVICTKYDGNFEIYKHGFVTTTYGKKYITYNDGTPFFYLGDTHWSLGDETVSMVKTITQKRAEQGFTVFQSEPIGAKFYIADGISQNDIDGFRDYDEKFKIIANAGLVHANAQFFFPDDMRVLLNNFGGCSENNSTSKTLSDSVIKYLEKISRYWVARYSSYPVMWTLGQEVDNDFYWSEENHPDWNKQNNPYKLVAEYIEKYDAYSHPLSAHQENSSCTAAYGNGKGTNEKLKVYFKDAEPSAFRDVYNHSWYAAQWSPDLTKQSNQKKEKDFWYNSQGKPVINYEGRYCYLWTKNFGSRMQGWSSYLSGMFGYGWGAHDTWSYLNIYDEENDSNDGVDTITSEEKINATWQDALEYPSSYQMSYMKNFFTSFDWWNLVPRFNNILYFRRNIGVYSFTASNAVNSEMVIYFYNFNDSSVAQKPNSNILNSSLTGTIGSLKPSETYKYKWFNPQTGEFSEEQSFKSSPFGTYKIGERKWNGKTVDCDMVFYLYQ